MRVVKQKTKFNLQNFDYAAGSEVESKHGPLFPNTVRCIIAGPSNSGKTNVVFNLLFDSNGLVFKNLYIFSKTLNQPKYRFLATVMPAEVGFFAYDDNSQVISPNDAEPHSIMIFDDIACEKHDNIRNFFTMGRHNDIEVFYLGQTYSRIPKQLVRDNANFIILFKQDDMNLRHIYNDHVNTDMPFGKFKALCSLAWKDNYGFLTIDKDKAVCKGRYRIGIDSFIESL